MTLCLLHHTQYNYFQKQNFDSKEADSIPLSNSVRTCNVAHLHGITTFESQPTLLCASSTVPAPKLMSFLALVPSPVFVLILRYLLS